MDIIKKILRWISKVGLQLTLGLWIIITALVMIIGTPEPIKNTLEQGGAYNEAANFIAESLKVEQDQTSGELLDTEQTQRIVKQVFTPEKLEDYTEKIIDGTYNWLEGGASEPSFKIDLSKDKKLFVQATTSELESEYKNLPTCSTAAQIRSLDINNPDCLPPGVSVDEQTQRIEKELSKQTLFKDDVFSADDLNITEEQKVEIPKNFQDILRLPSLLALISLVLAGAIILLSKTKRRGVVSLSRIFISAGIMVLFFAVVFGQILPSIASGESFQVNGETIPAVTNLVKEVASLISIALIKTSGALVIIGIIIMVAEHFYPQKEQESNSSTQ